MKSKPLPRRQRETLAFIVAYTTANGYPPRYREIALHLQVNPSVARKYVGRLELKGYVRTAHRMGIQEARQST